MWGKISVMNESTDTVTTYRPVERYAFLGGAGLLAALFCGWALWRTFDWITLIFLFGCLFAAASFGVQLLGRVEVDATGLRLETPLGARRVEFRQLDSATEAGRLLRVVVVTYHPLLENGLLDLDDLRSVTLPAVNQQYELLELLQQHAPQPAQPLSRE